ncbi:MAG TPA: hypothetical protein VNA25_02710 [Phycisphaerae bacterium]|nr:hypothetical protein [Phycisphaerae bacterium]HUT56768.1 hypothetical protein [Phycisphaerae bacterium]
MAGTIVRAVCMLLLLGCGAAAEPTTRQESRPAPEAASSQPTSQPTSAPVDPNVVRILDALEATGQKHATVQADVFHRVVMRMSGDREERTGHVGFQRRDGNAPAMFYIRFDTLRQGAGQRIKDEVEYAFDGEWLTEAKHRIKTMTRWQVVPKGQQADPLKLGKGPFPVPFGQKTEDVLRHFRASTRPPKAGDPNGTDYVQLVTRDRFKDELSFLRLEMWIDRATRLPVKLITANKNKEVTTVVFSNVQTDEKVDPKLFRIPLRPGWQYRVVPLNKPQAAVKQ